MVREYYIIGSSMPIPIETANPAITFPLPWESEGVKPNSRMQFASTIRFK